MRHSVLVVLALAGCSYDATPASVTSFATYTTYSEKVPGRYALLVDSDEMQEEIHVRGFVCSAHSFPVDMRDAFRTSVLRSLQNSVTEVVMVEPGLDGARLSAEGFDGLITVRVEDYSVELDVIQGYWSAKMEAEAEVDAGVIVERNGERVVARGFGVDKDATTDAGTACDGGADAIRRATADAVESLLQQIVEEVASAPALR